MPFIHDETAFEFQRLKQVNLPTGRFYTVESGPYAGESYPSITRVLAKKEKPQLEAWKVRVGPDEAAGVSARATVQGSAVHKLTECYLSNQGLPRYMPNVAELWGHLRPWLDKHVTKVYSQEQDIFSAKLGVAGRMDLLIEYDNEFLTIADVKTSSRLKLEEYVHDYFLQGTFYSVAVYEQTGTLPKKIVLPVTSPQDLQVFETTPMQHFKELAERIEEFYESYAGADAVA
jgi:hypothetical protein